MVDPREQLQPMRVERLAQPRLHLLSIAAGSQLDRVRTLLPAIAFVAWPPPERTIASATFRVLAKGDLDGDAAFASAVDCPLPLRCRRCLRTCTTCRHA
jgi:hypothetical protein